MKIFLRTVCLGIIFLAGFIVIHMLPEATFGETFKSGLMIGWIATYVAGFIFEVSWEYNDVP